MQKKYCQQELNSDRSDDSVPFNKHGFEPGEKKRFNNERNDLIIKIFNNK